MSDQRIDFQDLNGHPDSLEGVFTGEDPGCMGQGLLSPRSTVSTLSTVVTSEPEKSLAANWAREAVKPAKNSQGI